jgi:hypothetical protein
MHFTVRRAEVSALAGLTYKGSMTFNPNEGYANHIQQNVTCLEMSTMNMSFMNILITSWPKLLLSQ